MQFVLGITPFQAGAALGDQTFSLLFLERCGFYLLDSGGCPRKTTQGVTPILYIAALVDHEIPVLPLELCGFILFRKAVWYIKIYQGVGPFQSVATLGACTFLVLLLSIYELISLGCGGCPRFFRGSPLPGRSCPGVQHISQPCLVTLWLFF